MSLESQLEREEQMLEQELNEGIIDLPEYKRLMRKLQRDFWANVEDETQQAYSNVMDNYYG